MGAKANLLIYMQKKNIKKPEFYKITGLSNGFLDKNDGITSGALETIVENFSDLSLEWLITGRGEMLRNDQNQNIHNQTHTHSNNLQNSQQIAENQCKDTKNISNIGDFNNIQQGVNISGKNSLFTPNDITYLYKALAQKDEVIAQKDRLIEQKDKQISELYFKVIDLSEKIINLANNSIN